jgi:TatD DNase family protein
MVKSRNEPALIGAVANVVALVKGVDVETVCEAAWRNTMDLFWPEASAREKEAEAGEQA